MYKTTVYTLVNGRITHQKQQIFAVLMCNAHAMYINSNDDAIFGRHTQWRSRTFGRLMRWSNLPPFRFHLICIGLETEEPV